VIPLAKFFPAGLDARDSSSPADILLEARTQWERESSGALTLDFTNDEIKEGLAVTFVRVIHLPSQRSASLFEVGHRPDTPYPVAIQPDDDDLPKLLRKSYYEPGSPGLTNWNAMMAAATLAKTEGKTVKNDWVADTPAEFRAMLEKAFNLGYVKGIVVNLLAQKIKGGDPD
jgi:hypothetical protein